MDNPTGGAACKVRVWGYDYGVNPQWIPAVYLWSTAQCHRVRFQLKSGRWIERYFAVRNVDGLDPLDIATKAEVAAERERRKESHDQK